MLFVSLLSAVTFAVTLPADVLLKMASSMDSQTLSNYRMVNKDAYIAFKPIFDFKRKCGISQEELWPNLSLKSSMNQSTRNQCLSHLTANKALYSTIRIENDYSSNDKTELPTLIEAIRLINPRFHLDIEIAGLKTSDIPAFFSSIGDSNVSLFLQQPSWIIEFPTILSLSLANSHVQKLVVASPKWDWNQVGYNPVSLLVSDFHKTQIKAFSFYCKPLHPPYHRRYYTLPVEGESFRGLKNSTLESFSVDNCPLVSFDIDELVYSMPPTLKEIRISLVQGVPGIPPSSVFRALFSNGSALRRIELDNFVEGFKKDSTVFLEDALYDTDLETIALTNCDFNSGIRELIRTQINGSSIPPAYRENFVFKGMGRRANVAQIDVKMSGCCVIS